MKQLGRVGECYSFVPQILASSQHSRYLIQNANMFHFYSFSHLNDFKSCPLLHLCSTRVAPWQDVLVDVSLSLLSRPASKLPSAPLREAVEAIWRLTAEQALTPVGTCHLPY